MSFLSPRFRSFPLPVLVADSDAPEDDGGGDADSPLEDIPDGSGCTEIWEHLSERRDE